MRYRKPSIHSVSACRRGVCVQCLDLQRLLDAIEQALRRLEDGARRRVAPIRRRRLVEVGDERNVSLARRSEDVKRAYLRALKEFLRLHATSARKVLKLDEVFMRPANVFYPAFD